MLIHLYIQIQLYVRKNVHIYMHINEYIHQYIYVHLIVQIYIHMHLPFHSYPNCNNLNIQIYLLIFLRTKFQEPRIQYWDI
jgi:hypothetical protein